MGPFLGVIAAALAQEPEVPPAPPPDVAEEVIVWGRLAIDRARDAVVRELEGLGFRESRRPDGTIVFRRGSTLVRKLTLAPDGTLTFGRPVAGLADTPPPPQPALDPKVAPAAEGGVTMYVLPGDRKIEAAQDEVRTAVQDEIATLQAVQRRTVFEEQMLALPDQLDQLWTDGTPLDPGPVLATPDDRRRAVLTRWATRADTEEGRRVQAAIEAWLGSVVQASDHPITDAERAEFEGRAGRPLPP